MFRNEYFNNPEAFIKATFYVIEDGDLFEETVTAEDMEMYGAETFFSTYSGCDYVAEFEFGNIERYERRTRQCQYTGNITYYYE
jgi:hypothetical protein